MEFTEQQCAAFGAALNEARLLAVEVETDLARATVTIAPHALPAGFGPAGGEAVVELRLGAVGRVAASLRHGTWDDPAAMVEDLEIEGLAEEVEAFGGLPVFGWEFLDAGDDETFARWEDQVSVDWWSGLGRQAHTLDLFQEQGTPARSTCGSGSTNCGSTPGTSGRCRSTRSPRPARPGGRSCTAAIRARSGCGRADAAAGPRTQNAGLAAGV